VHQSQCSVPVNLATRPVTAPDTMIREGRALGQSCELFFSRLGECDGGEREAALAPGVEATLQGADALDAVFSEEQRHTGAGGFVWSSAIENDLAVARESVVFFFQLLGIHAEGAGNGFGIGFEIHGMAQVHDDEFFASVDF
jgi:hypothetical protein